MGNNVSFGPWELNLFIQFVRQKFGEGYQLAFTRPGSMTNVSPLVFERWQNPGDIAPVQKFSNSNSLTNSAYGFYRSSDGVYEDASFIRLKNIEFAYNLDSQKLKTIIKSARIFFQGQNLLTITPYRGADPETKDLLPTMKLFSFGVSLTF